jgi:hypothetical protein
MTDRRWRCRLAATTATLTSSVNSTTFGQSVALTATVSPAAATGTVQFFDGAASLGAATLAGGAASLSTSGTLADARTTLRELYAIGAGGMGIVYRACLPWHVRAVC